ncbi:unnamed protein product [Schistosoma margrebowiei]|uniref:Uncharacterized protein n=1 Tax=Schistosoma margrebowiei TaxID=48269 RepID=A0A183N4U9_9TREM|nr:unnamed protein product [Schistosoma margrebowiei]
MPRLERTTPDVKTSSDDTDGEKGTKMVRDLQTYVPSINWSWAKLYSHINAFRKSHKLHRITLRKTKSTISASTRSSAINSSRTRTGKAKAQAEYTQVDKQVKRSIRTDKRKYMEDLAMTVEKAAREGNMRELYDIKKKLSGNDRKPERPRKSKEGKVITNIEEQQNRWVEHFKELLNRSAPLNPPNIEVAPTDLPIHVDPRTIEEISMAIRQTRSGKTAGPDNIPAEVLKADTSTFEGKCGIQWTARMQLADLDFADDLTLLSHTQQQMQEKTTNIAAASAAIGLNINKGKARFSDTTQHAPIKSHITEKLWRM